MIPSQWSFLNQYVYPRVTIVLKSHSIDANNCPFLMVLSVKKKMFITNLRKMSFLKLV